MNDLTLKSLEKTEGGKLWRKCLWKNYNLEAGEHSLGESIQGIAIIVVMKGNVHFLNKSGGDLFWVKEHEVCMVSIAPPYNVMVQENTNILMCIFPSNVFPFDKEIMGRLIQYYKKREDRDYSVLKANDTILAFAQLMIEYMFNELESDLLFDIKRQELFLLLFITYSGEAAVSFFYPLIGEGLEFKEFVISNHIKAKNVQQLAKIANYSTSGFIKKFMRYFNESPYHWMLRQKAKIILEEISSSPIALKEIAYKYNFATYQHFREFCKMQFGVTPSLLRGDKKDVK